MHKSARILLIYIAAMLSAIAASGFLTYQIWVWQSPFHTLGHELRPIALILIPLAGLGLAIQIAVDPLAWRVVRMLRSKERHARASIN